MPDSSLEEWKKMSDGFTEYMEKSEEGLIFRNSIVGENGNIKCILKWESRELQEKANQEF